MEKLKEWLLCGALFTVKVILLTVLASAMCAVAVHVVDFICGTSYATADNIGLMALCTVTLHFGFTDLWEATNGGDYEE